MDIFNQLINLDPIKFQAFLFIFFRISGLIMVAPIFSNRNMPVMAKIGFIFFLSVIVFGFTSSDNLSAQPSDLMFLFSIIKELAVGFCIGFAARLIFAGIQIAGQLVDYQMGFGFVNVVDPESKLQVPLMGQYLYIISILIFFLINGHHWMIRAVVKSFQDIPLGAFVFRPGLVADFINMVTGIFVVGFKLAAPLALLLFLVDLAYGIIARAVPQANIMVVGFPVKIGLGLFVAVVSLPLFFMGIKRFFTEALLHLNYLTKLM
jgi:flagellar biosynthesis protein FliR